MKITFRYPVATLLLCAVMLSSISSCSGRSSCGDEGRETSGGTVDPETSVESRPDPVVAVKDDATGEILGVMVNEVGDYYIINPGDEEFIPKEGHSIVELDDSWPAD